MWERRASKPQKEFDGKVMESKNFFGRVIESKKPLGRVIEFFELPREVLQNLPRLVLNGRERLVIENHRGLTEYSDRMVRVRTAQGEIGVIGEDLNLTLIAREEIWVEGRISRIELPKWRG